MNQLQLMELRLLIEDRVEKAKLLISDVARNGGKLSDEVYAKLMEAYDVLHNASVLCKLQHGEGSPNKSDEVSDKAAE